MTLYGISNLILTGVSLIRKQYNDYKNK